MSVFRALLQLSRGKNVKDWAFITSAIVTAPGFGTFSLFLRIVNLETDTIAIASYIGFLVCLGFLLLGGGHIFVIGYMMLSFYHGEELLDQNVVFRWFIALVSCLVVWGYALGAFSWEMSDLYAVHPSYAHRGPLLSEKLLVLW
jgi:hypothetical protein